MADTNRVGIGTVDEVTWGVTPASPVFSMVRFNNTGFGNEPETVASNEIRADRNVSDMADVGNRAAGSITTELSYGNLDALLRGLLCNPWTLRLTSVPTAAAAAAFTVADAPSYTKGMMIRSSGFATAANNTLALVTTTGSGTSVPVVGSGVVVEGSPPAAARITLVGFQGASGDVAATLSSGIGGLTATATSGPLNTLGILPGDWILVGGKVTANRFATAANNGWCRVATISATAITFDRIPTGWTADVGAGKTIRFTVGDRLRNGVAKYSYSVLEFFTDVNSAEVFTGQTVGSGSISLRAGGIIEAGIAFEGKDSTVTTGLPAGATQLPVLTNPVMNAANHVARISSGNGWALGVNYVTSLDIQMTNNLRDRRAISFQGAVSKGYGQFAATGNFATYFEDPAFYAQLRAGAEGSLDFPVIDDTGAGYFIDVPRTFYTRGAPEVPGSNQDVMLTVQWAALVHKTLGYAIHLGRYSETI